MSDFALSINNTAQSNLLFRPNRDFPFDPLRENSVLDSSKQQEWLDTTSSLTVQINEILDTVIANGRNCILEMIGQARLPEDWLQDGIESPTGTARVLAEELMMRLFVEHKFLPDSVGPTVEGGIAVVYKKRRGKYQLFIEIFNNGEIGALLLKGRKVVAQRELHGSKDQNLDDLLARL